MKIAVLGRGFLGKEYEKNGIETLGRDKFSLDCDYENGIPHTILWSEQWDNLKQYDVIINCIGKSNTRWCEDPKNFHKVMAINAQLPKYLSEWCKINNKKFVHISTGCLYDSCYPEQKETDFLVAHCKYTVSKWAGEVGCDPNRDLILRPRLYFSNVEDRNNLLCKITKFTTFVNDKADSMASTKLIVDSSLELLKNNQTGIFNICHEGNASIFDVASWCGINSKIAISSDYLRKREGLYLVNNVMNIDKLKQFYKPTKLKDAIITCFEQLMGK